MSKVYDYVEHHYLLQAQVKTLSYSFLVELKQVDVQLKRKPVLVISSAYLVSGQWWIGKETILLISICYWSFE